MLIRKAFMEYSFLSKSESDTAGLGERLAKNLNTGAFIALTGDLGAGKTVFVKGLARGLGIKENVISPTFLILREYEGKMKLRHFDMYRIKNDGELEDIGFDEYMGEGVMVVEWADMIKRRIPDGAIMVDMLKTNGENKRVIKIKCPEKYKKAIKAALEC